MLKKILAAALIALTAKYAAGSCAGNYLAVYPRAMHISSNPAFLIDFSEKDFRLRNEISQIIFTAVSAKGRHIKLFPLSVNFSGTMGQVFLKAGGGLQRGDTVSIIISHVNGDSLGGMTKNFAARVARCQWVVAFKPDRKAPRWVSDSIGYSFNDMRSSSEPGYSIRFNPCVTDNSRVSNNYRIQGKVVLPLFYEVTLANEKFICMSEAGSSPSMDYSICGSDFSFGADTLYTAAVRPVDSSGNFGRIEKRFIFSIPEDSGGQR